MLVADDDRSSRYFLVEALGKLGCDVVSHADGPPALDVARERRFDFLLLDCRMPRGGAEFVATRLRHGPHAASARSPIVATSADVSTPLRQRLLRAGCLGVVEKPLSIRALSSLLKSVLPASRSPALLDDAQALASSGNETTMRQLRSLFAEELRLLLDDLDALMATPTVLSERLHRLRAACGFCGATALAEEALRVKFMIDQQHAMSSGHLAHLRRDATATLDALLQQQSSEPDSPD